MCLGQSLAALELARGNTELPHLFRSSLIFSNSSEHTLTARGATGTINCQRLRNLQFSWDVEWENH